MSELQRYLTGYAGSPGASLRTASTANMTFHFPAFRSILWDRTPQRDCDRVSVHVERFLPTLIVPVEIWAQVLSLASTPGDLGTLRGEYRCDPGDAHVFTVDEFRSALMASSSRDNISVKVVTGPIDIEAVVISSLRALKSREFPRLSSLMSIVCSVSPGGAPGSVSIAGEFVVPSTSLALTRINPLGIVGNPLGCCLQKGNLAQRPDADFSFGYLTLDQFRKVVPLQDTDPLSYSCPLVGLWVYSDTDELRPDSVHVWAGCIRYLHNDSIAERVSPALLTFLVLVACRSSYAFYECQATVSSSLLSHYTFGAKDISIGRSDRESNITLQWRPAVDELSNVRFLNALQAYEKAHFDSISVTKLGASSLSPKSMSTKSDSPRVVNRMPHLASAERARYPASPPPDDSTRALTSDRSVSPLSSRSQSPLFSNRSTSVPLPRPHPMYSPHPHPSPTTTPLFRRRESFSSLPERAELSPHKLFEMQQQQFELLQQQVTSLQRLFELETLRYTRPCACGAKVSVSTNTGASLGYNNVVIATKENAQTSTTLSLIREETPIHRESEGTRQDGTVRSVHQSRNSCAIASSDGAMSILELNDDYMEESPVQKPISPSPTASSAQSSGRSHDDVPLVTAEEPEAGPAEEPQAEPAQEVVPDDERADRTLSVRADMGNGANATIEDIPRIMYAYTEETSGDDEDEQITRKYIGRRRRDSSSSSSDDDDVPLSRLSHLFMRVVNE